MSLIYCAHSFIYIYIYTHIHIFIYVYIFGFGGKAYSWLCAKESQSSVPGDQKRSQGSNLDWPHARLASTLIIPVLSLWAPHLYTFLNGRCSVTRKCFSAYQTVVGLARGLLLTAVLVPGPGSCKSAGDFALG